MEDIFPSLKNTRYKKVSPKTGGYNCIAWAANCNELWWDPANGYYWPDGIQRGYTIDILAEVYKQLGFVICQDSCLEDGFEKIAIYGVNGDWTHAARQLENGAWVSKIGVLEDIEHASLDGLTGEEYGKVVMILKRKRQ